jgi:hypothetical protein
MCALIGDPQVGLLKPVNGQVERADVCRWRGRLRAGWQVQAVDRKGVGHGRGFQVDIQAAIKIRSGGAVDEPAPVTVRLQPGLARSRHGPGPDARLPRRPGSIQFNAVGHDPCLAVLDGGGGPLDDPAAARGLEVGDLEPRAGLPVLPASG